MPGTADGRRSRRSCPASPVTAMVLPAPVSPVTTANPGDSSRTASSITPRAVMWTSSSMGARLLFPVRPLPAPLGTSLLRNLLLHTAVAGAALVVPAWPAPAPASDRQAELGDQPVGERGTSRRAALAAAQPGQQHRLDRKSTRLNSSH